MSDVFISYAREDRERAQALAQALEARGLTVWWDREIPAGRQFDEVIEHELDAARCAVVLWSSASAGSKWVKAEAGEALQQDKLLPALLEPGLRLPLEFRRVQAADLSGWAPGQRSVALDDFCGEVATAVDKAATTPRTQARARKAREPVPVPVPASTSRRWWWIGGGTAAIVLGAALVDNHDWGQDSPPIYVEPVQPGTVPAATAGAGLDQVLRWRDYALNFEGRLQWDGRTSVGTLGYRAVDSASGRAAAQGSLTALVLPNTGNRLIFHAQIPVPMGDSNNASPHSHAVNLIFERGGSGWVLAANCMDLNRPDQCWR